MSAEAVKVMVRCRPMSQKEKDRGKYLSIQGVVASLQSIIN